MKLHELSVEAQFQYHERMAILSEGGTHTEAMHEIAMAQALERHAWDMKRKDLAEATEELRAR